MSDQNNYMQAQARRFNKKTKRMKKKMEQTHKKQMKIFLQRQLNAAKRAEKSMIMQKTTQSELEKRRCDEIIARRLRVPGPNDFIEYSKTSAKLATFLISSTVAEQGKRSSSTGSLPRITPQERLDRDRKKEKQLRLEKQKQQQDLKRRADVFKKETEAKFKMQLDKIQDKELHLKIKDQQRAKVKAIKRKQKEYQIKMKREALAKRIENASLVQQKMLKEKYEKHLKKEHLKYMQMVEREILEEFINEENEKKRLQKEAHRQKNQEKRIEMETTKINDLLRKEEKTNKKLEDFYQCMQEHRYAMSMLHNEKNQHGKEVFKQMKDRHQMAVNNVLMRRAAVEHRMNDYNERLKNEANERRLDANLRDEDRLSRINRVYDLLAERNEIKQAMYESSQYRHEILLEKIKNEKKAENRLKALKRNKLLERIKLEREIQIQYRERQIEEQAALRKAKQQSNALSHENNKLFTSRSKYKPDQGNAASKSKKKKQKIMVHKSSEEILHEIEQLRARQDYQLDIILNEEEVAEKIRNEAEASAAAIDVPRVVKDHPRQRRLAYERIQRLRNENDIVLNNKLNEYFKTKHKEELEIRN